MDINRVCISGNLTNEAKLEQLQSGLSRLKFSVAVHENKKNQQTGEWGTYANFVDCTMFGTRAESIAQYLTKGKRVAVEGRLHFYEWLQDDMRRTSLTVTVDELVFMSSNTSSDSSNNNFSATRQPQQQNTQYQKTARVQPQPQTSQVQMTTSQNQTQPVTQPYQQEQLFEVPQTQSRFTNAQFDDIYGDEIPF